MKIAVVGAGAMGSLFGGLLAEAGTEVWLFDIRVDHIAAINKNGLSVEKDGMESVIEINATTDSRKIGQVDLAIIFVKSAHTGAAAKTAGHLVGSTGLVLTLQNGLGNADIIADAIDPKRTLSGTTSHGATLLGLGKIRHAGIGPTKIGMWSGGNQSHAVRVGDFFTKAGLPTEIVSDIRSLVWDKLLINIGINAITALTGIKNERLLDLEATRNLSRAAVEEAATLARKQGITVREKPWERVFEVAEATRGNRSSMGQDIDNKRRTEIDAINGAVVREARKVGLPTPVNQTLTALIETLQTHYR